MLVGFTGLKGSGKDTAAQALCLHYGYTNLKFAGPLKAMCDALLKEAGVEAGIRQRAIEGDLKEVQLNALNGHTPRHAMQTLGTEWGRELLGQNFWTGLLAQRVRANPGKPFVVSDVRFPNEVNTIHDLGGVVVRVVRPGLTAESHSSEAQIATLDADVNLYNDRSLSEFVTRVRYWYQDHVTDAWVDAALKT